MSHMADDATTSLAEPVEDRPRVVTTRISRADLAFRTGARLAGLLVLAITGLVAAFLIIRASSTLQAIGWRFLTIFQWLPVARDAGVGAILPDTILIAISSAMSAMRICLLYTSPSPRD